MSRANLTSASLATVILESDPDKLLARRSTSLSGLIFPTNCPHSIFPICTVSNPVGLRAFSWVARALCRLKHGIACIVSTTRMPSEWLGPHRASRCLQPSCLAVSSSPAGEKMVHAGASGFGSQHQASFKRTTQRSSMLK